MTSAASDRAPALAGQTVLVIGGSAGIGLATARAARAEGAEVIITARDPERLATAATDLGAVRSAAFDATDPDALLAFLEALTTPIDHVMVTAGAPSYGPLMEMSAEAARGALSEHLLQAILVARAPPGACGRAARWCSWAARARDGRPSASARWRPSPRPCPR